MKKTNNTFSTKIDLTFADKLKNDLVEQGFKLTQPIYTIFSAQKEGIICTLYTSGALVVQGKEKGDFIEFYLEPEILKSFPYTNPEANLDLNARIGVDEAGKGDFFGPLCIAAFFAQGDDVKKLLSLGVCDSKKLSDKTIAKIAKELKRSFAYSVVTLFPKKYNELYSSFQNLNSLLGWGHATAIDDLHKKTGCSRVIIDKFADKKVVEMAVKKKNLKLDLLQKTQGESDIVVAAASIMARNAFLEGLETLSKEIGATLPKGAANIVIEVGKKLVEQHGVAILEQIAKTHFVTKNAILS